jgi:hypothetical protein
MRRNYFFSAVFFGSLLATYSADVRAEGCSSSSITKPSPFMGNNDEVFVLSDGSIWQVKYEYEYLYEYQPKVLICRPDNVLIVKGKKLNVVPVSQGRYGAASGESVIESRIDGAFKGWTGETIYKLQNGQIWQQSSYHYNYHYAYSPSVMIYRDGSGYKMIVDGDVDEPISVRRLK